MSRKRRFESLKLKSLSIHYIIHFFTLFNFFFKFYFPNLIIFFNLPKILSQHLKDGRHKIIIKISGSYVDIHTTARGP